jgi:hypothetical protein
LQQRCRLIGDRFVESHRRMGSRIRGRLGQLWLRQNAAAIWYVSVCVISTSERGRHFCSVIELERNNSGVIVRGDLSQDMRNMGLRITRWTESR